MGLMEQNDANYLRYQQINVYLSYERDVIYMVTNYNTAKQKNLMVLECNRRQGKYQPFDTLLGALDAFKKYITDKSGLTLDQVEQQNVK